MGSILSETRAGQVIQLIGVVIVLLAVADYIGIVDLLSIWFYPAIIALTAIFGGYVIDNPSQEKIAAKKSRAFLDIFSSQ